MSDVAHSTHVDSITSKVSHAAGMVFRALSTKKEDFIRKL